MESREQEKAQLTEEVSTLRQEVAELEERVRTLAAELEKATESVQDTKARFDAVYHHHHQLTGLLDPQGRLLLANKAALDFAGATEEDVIGQIFIDTPFWTHSQEERSKVSEAITQVLAGKAVRFDSTHISARGELRHFDFCLTPVFDENGQVRYMVPAGNDITERKVAEESLQQSERRFRSLFEQAGDYILVLDFSEEGGVVISDANQAAIQVHGYTRDEFLGMPLSALDTELDEVKIQATLSRVLAGESLLVETARRRKDGTVFPIEASIGLLDVGEGSSLIFSFERDITERRRAAEEREKLEGQLRQSQKMEAVGQLAGGVAHDFNNLLQAILGYGEMALEETGRGSSLHEKLSGVMSAANRAASLVRQLLAFSRRQVLKLEILDLNEVVEEFAKMIRRVIGEHISLVIQSEPGLRKVQADQGQLEQILMNLCVNARDAMPEGGRLTVATENAELAADFCRDKPGVEPGGYVLLSVCDTGGGIEQAIQERIFEPFFTTKGEGGGTGLGLATVYGIVRQHHGMVDVQSEVGLGTTFRVFLPISDVAKGTDHDAESPPPAGGTEVILLAEDDATVRRVTGQILERAGYTVFTARDGEEAIRLFDLHAHVIDLALLDVVMPRCSGRSVFQHIQKADTQTSVLFASGYTGGAVDTEFLLEEGIELIHKPYGKDDLLRTVRTVLDS